jgi:hypothetical protein
MPCIFRFICLCRVQGIDDDVRIDREDKEDDKTETDSDDDCAFSSVAATDDNVPPTETPYVENVNEELGQVDFGIISVTALC